MLKPGSPFPRITVLLALAFLALPAWAYLDPSTGSMILSAIVGIFATVALAVKTYWYRLKRFLRGLRRTEVEEDRAVQPGPPPAERPPAQVPGE